jgi:hypothetical protein
MEGGFLHVAFYLVSYYCYICAHGSDSALTHFQGGKSQH